MKKYNEKTFELEAKTGKGNFKVEVTVWQELKSAQSFKNVMMWESEMFIYVDNIKMKCSKYDKYQTTAIHSFEVCKHFGVPGNMKLRCDSKEVRSYINAIDNARNKEIANEMQEAYEENKRFEKMHNA
jgi:hypothetical protein